MADDVARSATFFRELFGFEVVFEADWYVSLRHDQWELGIVAARHETVPQAFRTAASGILLNVEVDDVDAEYRRLVVDGPLARCSTSAPRSSVNATSSSPVRTTSSSTSSPRSRPVRSTSTPS
jgi:catechol 2,3-dioxygenase-like lactoylglutathione lyase family enzyme